MANTQDVGGSGGPTQVQDRAAINLGRWGTGVLTALTISVIVGAYSTILEIRAATEQLRGLREDFSKMEIKLESQDAVQRDVGERLRVVETRVSDLWERR